eukprot:SAG31_NODE_1949_length_6833_cov_4.354024_9_plen_106_part_00
MNQSRYPKLQSGPTLPGPVKVGSFSPGGDSPFGVADGVGNVYQYTADQFVDDHTARTVLRGASNYRPKSTANWYFPRALELDKQVTYLLMDNSYERAGTCVNMRC